MKTLPKQLRCYVHHFGRFYSYSRYEMMWILAKAIKKGGDFELHERAQLKTQPACLRRNRATGGDDDEPTESFHSNEPTKRVVRLLDSTVEEQQDLLQ